jgi:hypothetical protein
MIRLLHSEWFFPLIVGLYFTAIGLIKFYGHYKGIVGGGEKPFSTRILGSCPTWAKHVNTTMRYFFLLIGLIYLAYGIWAISRSHA